MTGNRNWSKKKNYLIENADSECKYDFQKCLSSNSFFLLGLII